MTATKKRWIASTISLVVCFAMLIGTTFAWFTDKVTSGKNTIVAGNLDVELTHTNNTVTDEKVEGKTNLFPVSLWEPGVIAYENFTVKNVGNLALKYAMNLNISAKNTLNGKDLSQVILASVVKDGFNPTGDAAAKRTAAQGLEFTTLADFSKNGNLTAKGGAHDNDVYGVVLYWKPTDHDNDYNVNNGQKTDDNKDALFIDFGVELVATQDTVEADSFDKNYDIEAPWLGGVADVPAEVEGVITINSAEELAGFAKSVNSGNTYSGKTIKLGKDMDLNNINFPTANGGNGCNFVFDGNGKTIKNLKIAGEKGVGLFHYCAGATVKNLTVDGANVSGINQVGVIFGQAMCAKIENCTVKNAVITTSVKNNDDGDKAGAIAGYLTAQPSASIKDCVVENCTVKGYRDVGGAVGYIQGAEATNVSVKNTTVICDKANNYKNYDTDAKFDAGKIFGEQDSSPVLTNCTADTNTNVIYANGTSDAVAQQVASAKDGDTIKLLPSDTPVALPNITKGITLKGDGENTKVTTNKTNVSANGAVISDMTINGNGASGTTGELNISGNNTTVKNVTFIGEGRGVSGDRKLAVTVSTNGEGVVFENVSISNAFRGIQFWRLSGNSVIRDSVLDINGYTFNVDAVAANSTLTVENTTLNGWTSYTSGIKLVSFKDCKFGENVYKILKPYSNTVIENCEFCDGFGFSTAATASFTWTFNNCTIGGVKLTADNFASFIDHEEGWTNAPTVVIDGVTATIS